MAKGTFSSYCIPTVCLLSRRMLSTQTLNALERSARTHDDSVNHVSKGSNDCNAY